VITWKILRKNPKPAEFFMSRNSHKNRASGIQSNLAITQHISTGSYRAKPYLLMRKAKWNMEKANKKAFVQIKVAQQKIVVMKSTLCCCRKLHECAATKS
jgi:hypothetical protein